MAYEMNTQPITRWLQEARDGDEAAMSELFETIYPLLHLMASNKPGVVKDGALSPTAVVNELYLKVSESTVFAMLVASNCVSSLSNPRLRL